MRFRRSCRTLRFPFPEVVRLNPSIDTSSTDHRLRVVYVFRFRKTNQPTLRSTGHKGPCYGGITQILRAPMSELAREHTLISMKLSLAGFTPSHSLRC
jgi:hypothetical protein